MNDIVQMHVESGPICIGSLSLIGVSSSSSLLLGDTESITLYSYFDTPPESVIIGPLAPMPPLPEADI